jgi:hypothetical protein
MKPFVNFNVRPFRSTASCRRHTTGLDRRRDPEVERQGAGGAARGRLGELFKRSEAARTGIYVLIGPDPGRPGGTLAYVGEAALVAARSASGPHQWR